MKLHAAEKIGKVSSPRSLAGNFLWNLLGSSWHILLALVYLPYVVRGLGKEAYGIYAILVVLLSYFRFLDFGFSRSLEKYGAEAVGAGEPERLSEYFATAFWMQMILGAVGSGLLWVTGPLILSYWNIPLGYREEARGAIRLAAFSFGFSLAAGAPAAALRAVQRFRMLNGVSMVTETLSAGVLIGAVLLDLGLQGLMWALVVKSLAQFALLLVCSISLLSGALRLTFHHATLKKLFRFGGFHMLSGVIAPVLVNIEKAMMGGLLSMEAVAFYMVPYRLLDALGLIPRSLSNAIFPYLNALEGRHDRESMFRANRRATELLAWGLLPLFSLIWIAGHALLGLWLGQEFSLYAGSVLKILAGGFFMNMLAWNSLAVIQARGRPELPILFYIGEVIVYVPLAYYCMLWMGIVGAAWAWFARVAVDTVLMWIFASRLSRSGQRAMPPLHWKAGVWAALAICGGVFLEQIWFPGAESVVLGLLVAFFLVGLGWFAVLTAAERAYLPQLRSWKRVLRA